MTFSPRNTPNTPVAVEYTSRRRRVRKEFTDYLKARAFYGKKMKASARPQIIRADEIEAITDEEFAEYQEACPEVSGNDGFDREELRYLLRQLHGASLRSHDGFGYEVDKRGRVITGGEVIKTASSTWGALKIAVGLPLLVDFIEQLEYFTEVDADNGVERAIEVCGF